jgi:hypothetical protein
VDWLNKGRMKANRMKTNYGARGRNNSPTWYLHSCYQCFPWLLLTIQP